MNLTKYAVTALVLLGGVLGFPSSMRAAETNAPADSPAAERLTALHARMEQRAKELGLSEEQKEKIKVILQKYLSGLRSIHQNAEMSAEEKMAKMSTIREEIRAEFKKVMTPEQYAKWKEKEGQTLPGAQLGLQALQDVIESLNLSEDQKDKLRELHEEHMGKLLAMRDDLSLTLSDKLDKLAAMRKEVDPKMKEVLDAEQYKKWEEGMTKWLNQLRARVKGEKE